jgi:hypothetical protein
MTQRYSASFLTGLPAVRCLLLIGGPSAVFRVVPVVGVNSVERRTGESRLHVVNEIGKTLPPAVTDGNAASAIIRNLPRSVGCATVRAPR